MDDRWFRLGDHGRYFASHMNRFFRRSLLISINGAVAEAAAAAEMDHKYLRGRLREIAVRGIINPWLTSTYSTGTGKVADCNGNMSGEIDILIFANDTIPALLFSEDGFGLYPCESCLATIEVKSTLNATELKSSLVSSAGFSKMKYVSGRLSEEGSETIDQDIIGVTHCLFAFGSDIAGDELERYLKYANPNESRRLDMFCVVGKGFWVNAREKNGEHKWKKVDASIEFEEVVSFCSILSSGLAGIYRDRGRPPIGPYFGAPDPK